MFTAARWAHSDAFAGLFFYVIGNFVSYDIKTLSYTMLHWSIVTHA